MEDIIKVQDTGLLCDNENCDWTDPSVTVDVMGEWINRPCPKCGCNLLTLEDYNNVITLLETVKFMNSLTPEQLELLTKSVDMEEAKKSDFFKDATGLDLMNGESERVVASVNTHGTVKVTDIRKSDQ